MNKKNFKPFAASLILGSALAFTACSTDDDIIGNGDGYVTFKAQLPIGMDSRAFADGLSATNLQWVLYTADGTSILDEGTATFVNRECTVSIKLVTNEAYKMVFYADAFGADATDTPFTFDHAAGSLSVDYSKVTTNNEKFDAFYAVEDFTVSSTMGAKNVVLKRPFAQVNIATTPEDFQRAAQLGVNPTSAAVSTLPVYTSLNMFDGSVSGLEENKVTFADAPFGENETITVAGTEYKNLAMVYMLAPQAESSVLSSVDMTLAPQFAGSLKSYNNVPVRGNYRTNIVGNLLTSDSDWHIVIDQNFEGDLWMGQTETPEKGEDGVYHISSPAHLAGLAKAVNDGQSFHGEVFALDNDIDLNNTPWTPIGKQGKPFQGSFDGKGHTISNVNVSSDENAGLFGYIQLGNTSTSDTGHYIKDITLDNVTATGSHFVGALAGHLNLWYNNVSGVKVINSTINGTVATVNGSLEDANKIGGLCGYLQVMGSTVSDCSVSNTNITGIRGVGGFTGYLGYGASTVSGPTQVINNSVSNVNITVTPYDSPKAGTEIAEFSGNTPVNSNISMSGNTTSNVSIKYAEWDGKTRVMPKKNTEGAYQVQCAAHWAALTSVSAAERNQLNANVEILADIDFNNMPLNPMFAGSKLVINGYNHIMSNIAYNRLSDGSTGLFSTYGFQLKNITLKNVNYTQDISGGFKDTWLGGVAGMMQDGGCNVVLDNVHIDGMHLNGVVAVGGFIGQLQQNSTATINNCSIKNATLENQYFANESGFVAGFIGRLNGVVSGNNNSLQDVTINGIYVERRGETSIQQFVGYTGTNASDFNKLTNSVWGAGCTLTRTQK